MGEYCSLTPSRGQANTQVARRGSPVIALRALIDHRSRNQIRSEIKYLFIEKERARCEHLEHVLNDLNGKLPPNCNYTVINSTFDETLTDVLDNIQEQRAQLAPAFVMIDPFGVSETPMRVIGRILANPRSEVYISFMYREMNRFKEHPNFERHLDELFGCSGMATRHRFGRRNGTEKLLLRFVQESTQSERSAVCAAF